jgi:hypothetical protein
MWKHMYRPSCHDLCAANRQICAPAAGISQQTGSNRSIGEETSSRLLTDNVRRTDGAMIGRCNGM